MAFTLSISTVTTNANYVNIDIALDNRSNYGIIPNVEVYTDSVPTSGTVATYDKLTATTWSVSTAINARYKIQGFAFPTESTAVSSPGNYRVDDTGSLQKYENGDWANAEFDNDAMQAASVASNVIDEAIMSHAYLLRNQLNLKYITQVQKDIRNGDAYTNLYYKRIDLDYTDALINAAEYNWSLGLYSNFYDICKELNKIEQNYV